MSTLPKKPSGKPAESKSSWRLAWIVGGIALAVIGWSFVARRLPGIPFTLKRNAEGHLVPVATDRVGSLPRIAANLEAAQVTANNLISTSHRSHHSANDGFSCRRVAILSYSDHPLLEQVGREFPAQLSGLPFIQEVDYYPAGRAPAVGQRAPDLWITLDLGDLKTFGMLPRLSVQARINATAGSTLARGTYMISDSSSPPIVEHSWQATIDHKSTTTGVSADKYSAVAKNISEALAQRLTDYLKELHDKHGPLPELHDAFYPDYVPTPPLVAFDDWDAEQVFSLRGLMFGNETFWRVKTTDSVVDMLTETRDRFEQAGWKTRHFSADADRPQLTMTQEEDRLDIFVEPESGPMSHVTIQVGAVAEAAVVEPTTLLVHYIDRLTRLEQQAAVDRQLDQGGPFASLLAVTKLLRHDQRPRYLELLETQHHNAPQAWRALANEYAKTKELEKARRALRRAHWLAHLDPATDDQDAATRKMAKTLEFEELLKEQVSVELLREFGITELKVGETTAPVEVALDQPAFFFAIDELGDWHVLNWRFQATGNKQPGQRYQVGHAHASQGSSSWGSGSTLRTEQGQRESAAIPGVSRVVVDIEVLADDQFRLVGQIEPK